jgi:hypothetical protein
MLPVIPQVVLSALHTADPIGWAGARAPGGESRRVCAAVIVQVDRPERFHVGDAGGIDAMIWNKAAWRGVVQMYRSASGAPRDKVARTMEMLGTLIAWRPTSLLVTFPDRPCPPHVVVGTTWPRKALGREASAPKAVSGSWSGAAVAIGNGVRVVLYIPPSVPMPEGWPLVDAGHGWWTYGVEPLISVEAGPHSVAAGPLERQVGA